MSDSVYSLGRSGGKTKRKGGMGQRYILDQEIGEQKKLFHQHPE